MKLRTLFYFVVFMFLQQFVSAQAWIELLPKDKGASELTLFDYQKAFNDYWKPYNVKGGYYFDSKGKKFKAPGWKQFKRWEWYWEPRVDPKTGKFPEVSTEDLYGDNSFNPQQMPMGPLNNANWALLGPETSPGGYAGIGRINCVAFHPTDNNTYWVGSPSGGLWQTTDDGATWQVLTDNNDVLGVSTIIVHPNYQANQTIFIGTGDRDGGSSWTLGGQNGHDNNGVGVLKSTDGGATWQPTGLSFNLSDYKVINKMLMNPNDDQMMLAATNGAIYKTTDGGANWNQVTTDGYNFIDMEFKPGNPNVVYASTEDWWTGSKIYRSDDAGNTWVEKNTNAEDKRIELAVSPNQPDWLYAIAANSDGGLRAFYQTTDGGENFSEVYVGATDKALLGYGCDAGGDNSGQGVYDLCMAVDPADANIVYIGGVNSWKSTNGGADWSIMNHWAGDCGGTVQTVHADKHYLVFQPGTPNLFECNDGGVYKSVDAGANWDFKGSGLVISQMYRLGVSQTDAGEVIAGLQDNGTKLLSGGSWYDVKGGDGMECIIDYTDVNVQYGTYVEGEIERTTNHWTQWWDNVKISDNIPVPSDDRGAWVTPYVMDPVNSQTLYVGYSDVWKTTDRGDTWTQVSTMNAPNKLRSMAIAPSDNQTLYVADHDNIWKTTDGGTNWADVTAGLPTGTSNITYIAVKHDDPNTVWVTLGAYNVEGVYESTDGGTSWTNISAGLPQLPIMTIVQNKQNTSDNELYVGTDVGVYRKIGTANWAAFSDNLPNVFVAELEIYYDDANPDNTRLRAATFGRGLWETPITEDVDELEPCSALFFSEYVEADGQNKYLELFNPTCEDITLNGNYSIKIYNDGSTTPNHTIDLTTGTVPAQGTFVIARKDHTLYATPDTVVNNLNFGGDDAVELLQGTTTLDMIGQIGNDPGNEWGTGLTSTEENTLVRKSNISKGDSDGSDPFDPSLEWEGFPNNDVSHLGSHAIDPTVCPVPAEPALTITNNTCTPVVAGTITATGCDGTDEELQWSTDGGTTWSTTAPTYGTTAITVQVKCVNTSTGCESTVAIGTTNPTDCSAVGSSLLVFNDCSTPTSTSFDGFDGSGFSPSPTSGQLSSENWAITGFSSGALDFGGTATTSDLARGNTSGGVATGGVYSLDNGALYIQPGGSDFTPGSITLRIQNNSGGNILGFDIAYDIVVLNDQDRSNSFNFSYSTDDATYTDVPSLDYTSTKDADATPSVVTENKSATVTGIMVANGDYIYFRWTGDDVSGGGSRDEFGLDNISVTPTVTLTEPALTIINNTCTPVAAGTITATGCDGTDEELQWSTDGGTTWSTTAPAYDNTAAIDVQVKCVNTSTNCESPVATGTTSPNDCGSTGSGALLVNYGGPNIADPCTCADDCMFDEEVVVISVPGEMWTVVTNNGFFTPGTTTVIAPGTPLVVNSANPTQYTLVGQHEDGIGYFLTVTNGTDVLSVGNMCTDTPVFDTKLACDTIACGDDFPTDVPTVSDRCNRTIDINVVDTIEVTDYSCTGDGGFLVGGPQVTTGVPPTFPLAPYSIASGAPFDFVTGNPTFALLNGLGFNCDEKSGASLYGLLLDGTGIPSLANRPKVNLVKIHLPYNAPDKPEILGAIVEPPLSTVSAGETAVSTVLNYIGDAKDNKFYVAGVSIKYTGDPALGTPVHVTEAIPYLGIIDLNSCSAGAVSVSPNWIPIDMTNLSCAAYGSSFIQDLNDYLAGTLSVFPSGGMHDWAVSPDGSILYSFMGITKNGANGTDDDGALIAINIADGMATCTPGDAGNDPYTGMDGASTEEFTGMYFNGAGELMGWQSDMGRLLSIDIPTAALTLEEDGLPVDYRGDAASCYDCIVPQSCEDNIVKREYRVIEAKDGCDNVNYQYQLIVTKDETDVTLEKNTIVCESDPDVIFKGMPVPDQVAGDVASFEIIPAFASFVDNADGTAIFNPSDAGAGIWQVVYTFNKAGACCAKTDTVEIVVIASPAAPTVSDIEVCEGGDTEIVPQSNSVTPGGGSCTATSDLIITGVVDGPLSQGRPKGIELYVVNDIADLSEYGLGSANNGGGSDGEEFTFPADAVTAGTYIWVATDSVEFNNYFGFYPRYNDNVASINGDDAIELFHNNSVVDVFGDINVDGTGQAWEYMDGWAYRNSEAGNSTTFDVADWTFSGANALHGETTNTGATTPMPNGTYSCVQATSLFNFYSDITLTTLAAESVASYDPGTTPATSPQTFWVTEINTVTGCESEAVEVTVTVHPQPSAEVGANEFYCGLPTTINLDVNSSESGTWTMRGGSGTIDDIMGDHTSYMPVADDLDTTIVFVWTTISTGVTGCDAASDSFAVTIVSETADAEFTYGGTEFCPGSSNPTVSHTTGVDGIYTYTVIANGTNLVIDKHTGEIDMTASDAGTYEITNTVDGKGNLIITGVIDGTIPGGLPKAIELYAIRDITDLSRYGLESANNGNGINGVEYTFPDDAVTAGTYIWISSEFATFNTYFGFEPTYINNIAQINGDDAILLYNDGQIIDVFGQPDVDGTGEDWEYSNSWAYRKSNTGLDGSLFDIDNWTFGGVNALNDSENDGDVDNPFPDGTFTTDFEAGCASDQYSETITIGDLELPVVACPGDMTIQLDPGLCSAYPFWNEPEAIDNCDSNPTITKVSGPNPGDELTLHGGPYVVVYEIADASGNSVLCHLNITLEGYPTPTGVLACNDTIQVSVDTSCSVLMNADMFLEGGPYQCYNLFDVYVDHPLFEGINVSNDIISLGTGVYNVTVLDAANNNNSCETVIIVLDKMPPTIDCEDCPVGGILQTGSVMTEYKGNLDDFDPTGITNVCWAFEGFYPISPAPHSIEVIEFSVDVAGSYTFSMESLWGDQDGEMALYDQPVNYSDLCEGLVAGSNDVGGVGAYDPGITINLQPGTYYLAVSSYDPAARGEFIVTFTAPADASVIYTGANVYDPKCQFVGCFSPNDIYAYPELVYNDNCDVTVDSVDEVLEGQLCGTKIVRRTYTVTDGAGNTADCIKEFLFRGVDMNNFTWPKNWDDLPANNPMLLCDQDYPKDDKGNPSPEYTGYPAGYDKYCGTVEVFYNDVVYGKEDGVPCGWKILRYWTVVNDCTGIITKKIQVIRITDKTAPTFMAPASAVTISTGAYLCEGTYEVPALEHLEDNCDNGAYYYIVSEAGNVVQNFDGSWVVTNLPLGTTKVCYVVYDACQNKDTACVDVTVEDLVPPIAVCEQYKQVSLTVEGTAVVCAPDIDSGSLDNCNDVSFKVRRGMSGSFTDCVNFDCSDAGNVVMVTLRVYDQILPSGDVSASAFEGHYNDCMSNIEVLCKLPPVLTCENITVDCGAVLDPEQDPSLYPDVQAVCLDSMWYEDVPKLDNEKVCSPIKTRIWYARGCGDKVSQCSQKITMVGDDPFDPCTIQMPDDQTGMCSDPDEGAKPVYDEGPCNVVTATAVKRDTFKFVEGACYKVLVEWVVIDWCVYEELTPEQKLQAKEDVDVWKSNRTLDCKDPHYADGFDGYYRYTQTLMMVDNWAPEITVKDTCIGVGANCLAEATIKASATDTCNPVEEFHWKYRILDMDTWEVIQYSDDYVPEYGPANVGGGELDDVVEASIKLKNPLPIGTYKVEWTVGDGCGNAATESQIVEIVDNKAPTPILVDLSTALMKNCMVEICAVTFDKGGCAGNCISSFDNCVEKEDLYFTFTPVLPKLDVNPNAWANQYATYGKYFYNPETGAISNEEKYLFGEALAWDPVHRTSCKVYGINREGEGPDLTQTVDVYVWDKFAENNACDFNNYDYATAILILNDEDDDCPGSAPIISGMVSGCSSQGGINNVSVTFDSGERTRESLSTSDGQYTVGLSDAAYDVKAYKEIEGLSGLSTLDILMIQRHILGIREFKNPCQIASMDVNMNGRVTASDIFVLRKKILGKTEAKMNWNFMDESYLESYDAFSLSESYSKKVVVENGETTDNMNFVGVLAGDVNRSADGTVESRSAELLNFEMDNSTLAEGQVEEVSVYAKDFTDVLGGQFAINLSNLKLQDVKSGKLNITGSNYNVLDNNVLISWNETEGQSIADGEVLFTLVVEATSDVSLVNALSLNDGRLRAEAYKGSDLEISTIALSYRNASYALYQNNPNPFSSVTEIGFELPESAEYTLTIYDVAGKLVKVITDEGKAGYNTKTITKKDLNQSGVLYYRLESGDYTATKKMVILK